MGVYSSYHLVSPKALLYVAWACTAVMILVSPRALLYVAQQYVCDGVLFCVTYFWHPDCEQCLCFALYGCCLGGLDLFAVYVCTEVQQYDTTSAPMHFSCFEPPRQYTIHKRGIYVGKRAVTTL